ncbi:MAG: deoxynucleoside kinase [candidate division WOR-3 bacterium]
MRYIAVEGPIGAGKTALAQLLAQRLEARLILESALENPFLERFYADMRGYAFQAQVFFLLARHKQQRELRQPDLFNANVVSDYFFEKDRIYAAYNLTDHELALYERLYQALVAEVTRPDLVVYLQAHVDVLMERIRARGQGWAVAIDHDYLAGLTDAYNHFFLRYDATPLLIVNTERLDIVTNRTEFEELFRAIETTRTGRRFYSPRSRG